MQGADQLEAIMRSGADPFAIVVMLQRQVSPELIIIGSGDDGLIEHGALAVEARGSVELDGAIVPDILDGSLFVSVELARFHDALDGGLVLREIPFGGILAEMFDGGHCQGAGHESFLSELEREFNEFGLAGIQFSVDPVRALDLVNMNGVALSDQQLSEGSARADAGGDSLASLNVAASPANGAALGFIENRFDVDGLEPEGFHCAPGVWADEEVQSVLAAGDVLNVRAGNELGIGWRSHCGKPPRWCSRGGSNPLATLSLSHAIHRSPVPLWLGGYDNAA